VSGHKTGVAGVYNRSSYATEKRAALELWGDHVQTLVKAEVLRAVVKFPAKAEKKRPVSGR
jgi:hypothetical protein